MNDGGILIFYENKDDLNYFLHLSGKTGLEIEPVRRRGIKRDGRI